VPVGDGSSVFVVGVRLDPFVRWPGIAPAPGGPERSRRGVDARMRAADVNGAAKDDPRGADL